MHDFEAENISQKWKFKLEIGECKLDFTITRNLIFLFEKDR